MDGVRGFVPTRNVANSMVINLSRYPRKRAGLMDARGSSASVNRDYLVEAF